MPIGNYSVSCEEKKSKRGRPVKLRTSEEEKAVVKERKRNWLFVIYPGDSAPKDWEMRLRNLCVEGCISPLHDQDINEPDEQQKKAHRHVLLCFDGPVSWDHVKTISRDMLGGTYPVPCQSMRGSVRYFLHLDNPEKAQYSFDDMIPLGGFDAQGVMDITGQRLREMVTAMQKFLMQSKITEFYEFADYCLQYNNEWYAVLTEKRTMYFERYLRSRRFSLRDKQLEDNITERVKEDRAVIEKYREETKKKSSDSGK